MFKRFFALIIILSLFTTGCSVDLKKLFVKEKEAPVSNLSASALDFDGVAIHQKTEALLSSAKKSIFIEQSIFSDESLMNLVVQKAAAGVTQALIYSSPWTAGGFAAHTMSVLLTGKSVWKLAGIFNRDWQFTTTLSLDIPKTTDLPEDNILLATNANVKQQLIEQIAGSQKSVWAIVSQVTDQDIIQAFIDAANKGRDVRIILDPGIMPANWPETIEKLKASGIQLRYFKLPTNKPLELNVGIFDGGTFISSSSGWGYKSFVMNHELSLTAPAPEATLELIKHFDQDWQSSSTTP
ncbi:MAG: phosphatidylserine/phosphatidylglycerophosphate/cardiolipin synthase [Firmicutes bacterium]|nr:phosphatidylserine/phosphatidylglycerophosphate/cardiolipin synthase [Bacillota bacterium]